MTPTTDTPLRRGHLASVTRKGQLLPGQILPDLSGHFASEAALLAYALITRSVPHAVAEAVSSADFGHPVLAPMARAAWRLSMNGLPVTEHKLVEEMGDEAAALDKAPPSLFDALKDWHSMPFNDEEALIHAGEVQRGGASRAGIKDAERLALALSREDAAGARQVLARIEARLAEQEPASAVPVWPSLAARALALGVAGVILPTSFASLNLACRGGPRTGKVLVIGGAPGAGKTTCVVQMGVEWARDGFHVAILAADEDADGLLIRVGQQLGLERGALEKAEQHVREDLAARVSALPLLLVDADEEDASIDDVARELERRAGGKPAVLIVDSIQTARAEGCEETDGPRARVDLVMKVLKRVAKNAHHLVIATCELARAAYSSADAKDNINDLAAFKESGGVEYGATVAMVMRSVKDGEGMVDVAIAKNRIGKKLSYRIALDDRTARFTEVQLQDDDEGEEKLTATHLAKMAAMRKRILWAIEKTVEPLRSKNAIHNRIKGIKGNKGNRQMFLDAVDELIGEGSIRVEGKRFVIGSSSVEPVLEPAEGRSGFPVPRAHGVRSTPAQDLEPLGHAVSEPAGVATGSGGSGTSTRVEQAMGQDAAIQAALALDLTRPRGA